jgi:hypothetical protein
LWQFEYMDYQPSHSGHSLSRPACHKKMSSPSSVGGSVAIHLIPVDHVERHRF